MLEARLLVRIAGRPGVFSHPACCHGLELRSRSNCQPRGGCSRLVPRTERLLLRRLRLRLARGLSAAGIPRALLVAIAAAAAAPSAPSFTLLALFARRLLVQRGAELRLLLALGLLPRTLRMLVTAEVVLASRVVTILLVAVAPTVALLVAVALMVLALTALLPAIRLTITASAVPVTAFVPAAVLAAFRKRGARSTLGRGSGSGCGALEPAENLADDRGFACGSHGALRLQLRLRLPCDGYRRRLLRRYAFYHGFRARGRRL
jgi:hypothetical protein